MESTLVVF
jgi:hypothetical protein